MNQKSKWPTCEWTSRVYDQHVNEPAEAMTNTWMNQQSIWPTCEWTRRGDDQHVNEPAEAMTNTWINQIDKLLHQTKSHKIQTCEWENEWDWLSFWEDKFPTDRSTGKTTFTLERWELDWDFINPQELFITPPHLHSNIFVSLSPHWLIIKDFIVLVKHVLN